jgi:hypothetical protein
MVHRLRVTIHTEEDKSVKKDGSFYQKHVAASQTRYDQAPEQLPSRQSSFQTVPSVHAPLSQPVCGPTHEQISTASGPSALAVLKNFCDNHYNLTLAMLGMTVLSLIIAVIALVK